MTTWNSCVNLILTFVSIEYSMTFLLTAAAFFSLLFPKTLHIFGVDNSISSQGSNNSDHSSGYLSSSGGNGTMPISGAIDSSNYMDYKYASNGRVESLDIKLPLNNIQPLKKHSLASSLNDFSNNEAELDGPKWVFFPPTSLELS